LGEKPAPVTGPEDDWPANYFNYFTEIEEHFQRVRGTALFLMSPLDWALVEAWRNGGVPLEAVLRGIDVAFEKWRSRKSRIQAINSLAYCAQAVMTEAKIMSGEAPPRAPAGEGAPFSLEKLQEFLKANAAQLEGSGDAAYREIATAVSRLSAEAETHYQNLEELEQRLTALEDKMLATARTRQTEEDLFEARRDLDAQLRPYRGKMTAEQLTMLEKQYLERALLERERLPRLSLFYLDAAR
jgi:hypothetical protein